VPVVAGWRWLPEHHFGVLTQMDAREAFQALRFLRMLFFVLFLLLVLSANGFFLASYLGAAWRRRLTEAELTARQLGQYQLEEKIGEGGMGVVYRAHHALLRRETAIKLLLPDRADAETIRCFEREVRLTCQLTHPNTIQVYDYGRTPEGLFYYAMEYLEGLNLRDLITRFGPQPEGRVIHILCQVAEALREAHERGLVHRDIKPANVFLTHRGGIPDAVKVLDFGLVREYRAAAADAHGAGEDVHATVGTPLFMSPESIRSPGRSDPRTDIYSLGVLGYYLLTGRPVFEGNTPEEVTNQHLHAEPVPPSRDPQTTISGAFEAALLQCLKKDPERRPASVRELKAMLLQSPRAQDWTEAAREDWWRRHGAAVISASSRGGSRSEPETLSRVVIDRTVRVSRSSNGSL
jgi:serine/threonine protein kinase